MPGTYGVRPQVVIGTDPAAGDEIVETVPAGELWIVQSVVFQLVTDATAPVRAVALVFDDGANVHTRMPAATTQAASLTIIYTFFPTAAAINLGATAGMSQPLAEVALPAGSRIRTVTSGRAPGDNFGAPTLHVVKYH